MKKIFLAFALIACLANTSQAQHTTPRFPWENGTVSNGAQQVTKLITVTDGATATDTVFISPNASNTYVQINPTDTLNGTLVIDLANVTRSGVAYSKAGCWKYDNISIIYKESVVAKTIKLVGAFGVGGATYTITTGTTNGKLVKANYLFDGANFITN